MTRILLAGFAISLTLLASPMLAAANAIRDLGNLILAGWRYSADYVVTVIRTSLPLDTTGAAYAAVQLAKVRSFANRRLARLGDPLLTSSPAFA